MCVGERATAEVRRLVLCRALLQFVPVHGVSLTTDRLPPGIMDCMAAAGGSTYTRNSTRNYGFILAIYSLIKSHYLGSPKEEGIFVTMMAVLTWMLIISGGGLSVLALSSSSTAAKR